MSTTWKALQFYRVEFDESWKLSSTTNQLFTYKSSKQGAQIELFHESPAGIITTTVLTCDIEKGAIIHRDVLHVKAVSSTQKNMDK